MANNNVKSYTMFFLDFVVGMLSVSIANFFGGYYCVVVAVTVILTTMYALSTIDSDVSKGNKLNVIFMGILALFQIVFFIANDIFGYPVYQKGNINFFGIAVVTTQVYSVAVIVFRLLTIVFEYFSKGSVELVENIDKKDNDDNVKKCEDEVEKENATEPIKRIAQSNIKKEVPFMEEKI